MASTLMFSFRRRVKCRHEAGRNGTTSRCRRQRRARTLARCLLLGCLTGLSLTGRAQQSTPAAPPACDQYFSRGDPALFRFVDTREQVDYTKFAGMRIAGIEYVVLPIFNEDNPEENNWLFRTANTLHIETRPDTVERQMIISNGETLKPGLIQENERLLRDRSYLVDAMILPHKVCGNDIHLLAVVRDVWTLKLSASASRSGGENRTSTGLTEENLLGTGQSISVGYFKNADRSGRTFSYSNPHLLNDRTELDVTYQDNSDGEARAASLVHPFYQLDTRWSAGITVDEESEIDTIEREGQLRNIYRDDQKRYEGWYGWSAGRQGNFVQRWSLGFTDDEETYGVVPETLSPPPEDRRLRYPWVSLEAIEDRYWTTSNISHSHRHEDILLGFYTYLRAGYAKKDWDSTINAVVFRAEQRYTASFGDHHLLQFRASSDGRHNLDTDLPESTFYHGVVQYYHFPDRKNRWFARGRYSVARNVNQDEELSSGGENSLRGYPDDIQRGNRQWIFTVERRHFTDIHLFNLAYIGAAAYVDVGRTRDTYDPETRDNPTLSNIGIGLRASPSKFSIDKVLHLDIAVPLAERDKVDSYQIIVTGKVDF